MSAAILVLGASGFIGRRLAEQFAIDGNPVIAATRKSETFTHPGIVNVVAPFDTPADFVPLLAHCRWVVHAASTSTPGSTAGAPLLELEMLRVTLVLLHAMQEKASHLPLLYLSSGGTLYGDCATKAKEEAFVLPLSYHGAGKASAERFIHAWAHQHGGACVALRPSNVYGQGQVPRMGFGVIPAAFEHALERKPFIILGNGSAVRDYLHVDDLVALCRSVVASTPLPGLQIYNASRGTGTALAALLDAIDVVTRQPLQRIHTPSRAVDIHRIVPDNGAARHAFAWDAHVSLNEGLQQTWRWFTTRR